MRPNMKKCLKCKKVMDIAFFYKDKSTSDGHTRRCMSCLTDDRWLRREYNKDYQTIYRKLNKEVINEKGRTRHQRLDPRKRMLQAARSRSKRLGIPFNIELEDIVIPEVCPLLNIPFVKGTKGKYSNTYSLDRLDTNKGYIKGNVWVISMKANTMKSNATILELLNFATNILSKLNDDIVRTAQ